MGTFTRKPLGILDNIYRFVGGQTGPTSFAEEMAIQPVHDVSREAEIGTAQSAALGFFLEGFTLVHVGTGALFGADDAYARVFRDLAPEEVDIWIIDALCTTSDQSDFATANAGITYPLLPGTFPAAITKLVRSWSVPQDTIFSGGINPVQADNHPVMLPMYVPHGSQIGVRTTSDNAGTMTTQTFFLMWAGARGALPPGVA